MASRAQGRRGVDSVAGSKRMTVLWTQEWHGVDDVTSLGTTPVWSTVRVGNYSVEALGRTR
jgi:hypothetical protein